MPDDWPPVEVMDPWGRRFASDTRRPETPGPWFFPLQGAATTAGCRLVVAILKRLLADAGSIGIAVLTDCVIVPCSTTGGLSDVPGEREVRSLPRAELARILERFDALVYPGRPAWKLDKGTAERDLDGIVYGPNKVVIIDPSTGEVTWASEFAGPGVFADPVFGENLLPDGRRRWWRDGVQLVVDGEIPRGGWLDRMSVSTFRIDSPDLARYFFPPSKGGRQPRWPEGPARSRGRSLPTRPSSATCGLSRTNAPRRRPYGDR